MMKTSFRFHYDIAVVLFLFLFHFPFNDLHAENWPMWRYDAKRSAASPEDLPAELHLQWMRKYPQPEPVWDDPLNRDLMQFDTVYEPIVWDRTMFIASNATDRLIALDTESGEEKWSFFAQGPVRLPPVAANGKVYFSSDDGFLYCLDTDTGQLIWKYNGVPQDRLILGNERLVSTWVARGGPVLKDGIVYFASGIWPFMGVFIFALDADTGQEVWVNDSSSALYIKQPHNSSSFASVAPQGSLVISGDKLLVPGGRSVPACFDLKTGKFLYYHLAENGKTGGAFVSATDHHFVNYYRNQVVNLFDTKSGERIIDFVARMPVVTEDVIYSKSEYGQVNACVEALDYKNLHQVEIEKMVRDRQTREIRVEIEKRWKMDSLWRLEVDASGDLIKSGQRLYAGGENLLTAIDISSTTSDFPSIAWQKPIEGTVKRILAANGKLYAVTLDGKIYSFGKHPVSAKILAYDPKSSTLPESVKQQAHSILKSTGIRDGYGLVYGIRNGDLLEALVRQSDLRIVAFDPDSQKVNALRKRFTQAGLYGKRLSILEGDYSRTTPPYLASLILFEDPQSLLEKNNPSLFKTLYEKLRPYGGTVCVQPGPGATGTLIKTIQASALPKAKIDKSNGLVLVKREGALPGSDDWTHQYGDIANTVKSDDKLVKLPLGILWFGGSSNQDVLPRHGHGPPEQIVGGRLFIEGMDSLSARDAYTGRVLWKRQFPNMGNEGVYFDDTYQDTPLSTEYNQIHIPGANARGTNYVVTEDKIYLVHQDHCLVLDPTTGETLQTIDLPAFPHSTQPDRWGYIGVYKEYLIAGSGVISYKDFIQTAPGIASKRKPFYDYDNTSSKRLVIMNRHTGDVLWTFQSDLGLRHNAIIAGNDTLYCIDKMPAMAEKSLKRRGKSFLGTPRLLAFDIHDGTIRWSKTQNVFGTWLSYSEQHDVLIQAGRSSRDMLYDEPDDRMMGFRGQDGYHLWTIENTYGGPCIIHGETIITEPHAYNLLTGRQKMRRNPVTGEETPWEYTRNHGCNYSIASEYMMTFRSAAAGFFNLEQDAGTGNFGGFKSGCTSNLVAANGVLNAPDYTRTCSCSYQNQTSLAMIHDPAVENWTYNDIDSVTNTVRRLGINLGAPGDRRAGNGTLWLEYPIVGGPSPDIPIHLTPENPDYFLHHSARMNKGGIEWIAASGAKGIRKVVLPLQPATPRSSSYTVRLHFAEPEQLQKGDRVFHVFIQGKQVLTDFDILVETGAIRTGMIKEFSKIPVERNLVIELQPSQPDSPYPPVLCGIEVLLEEAVSQNNLQTMIPSPALDP